MPTAREGEEGPFERECCEGEDEDPNYERYEGQRKRSAEVDVDGGGISRDGRHSEEGAEENGGADELRQLLGCGLQLVQKRFATHENHSRCKRDGEDRGKANRFP